MSTSTSSPDPNLMVMHRDYIMSSMSGHCIRFVKGEKTYVPPHLHAQAASVGAQFVSDVALASAFPESKAPPPVLSLSERERKIMAAFDVMIARNTRGDFTASGRPSSSVVARLSDVSGIDSREVEELWIRYQQTKAEKATE